MTALRRPLVLVGAASMLLVLAIGAGVATGCGPFLTFRAYLRRSFWQPVRYMSSSLAATAPNGGGTSPYAGLSSDPVPRLLDDLRSAYRPLATGFPSDLDSNRVRDAERAAKAALAPGALEGAPLEEARLLDAKVAMRAAEAKVGEVADARRRFEAFLASNPAPARASEARTWLARVLYTQGDAVAAARIYLEELDRPSPVVSAEALALSLRIVFVEHRDQFLARADAFFDNPRHALFIVNLLTNPHWYYDEPVPMATRQKEASRILALLRERKGLFPAGADADALNVALMRTALFSGDVEMALGDARAIPETSPVRRDPEFNWMLASAFYLGGEPSKSEEPLQRMLRAKGATAADRRTAAQALVAVYLKTSRPVDALHASFIQQATGVDSAWNENESEMARPQWCVGCDSLDLPYLLDAALTKSELSAYVERRWDQAPALVEVAGGRKMAATDIVRYSLAVREAREEHYAEAERIYTQLNVPRRAARMRTLAALLARIRDRSRPAAERLQARYEQAAFLADNPERILFNDLLWRGFQQRALVGSEWNNDEDRESGMTAAEHDAAVGDDRRIRDEQEERWQAFLRLEQVAREAGDSPLARTAALKILDCLPRINTGRFGREDEISAAIARWIAWLRAHPRK